MQVIIFFTEVQLIYNVVLVSAVQKRESAIHIHISPLFWISFPFRSPQSIEQSSLCYKQVLISYLFYTQQCICQSQSPNHPTPPYPPWCPYICSLHLCLYVCFADMLICIIFLDSIYKRYYTIFVFLFLTYFTLYDSLQVHPRVCKWHSFVPFYG